jgi:hypothetical protein
VGQSRNNRHPTNEKESTMRTLRYVCLFAGALCLLARLIFGQGSSIAGTREGQLHGLKAVTLMIRQDGAIVSGNAVFYILKDEGSGLHVGAPSAPLLLVNPRWDGKVLRFSVSHGNWLAPFEMRVTGEGNAEGKRLAAHGEPEERVALRRR